MPLFNANMQKLNKWLQARYELFEHFFFFFFLVAADCNNCSSTHMLIIFLSSSQYENLCRCNYAQEQTLIFFCFFFLLIWYKQLKWLCCSCILKVEWGGPFFAVSKVSYLPCYLWKGLEMNSALRKITVLCL